MHTLLEVVGKIVNSDIEMTEAAKKYFWSEYETKQKNTAHSMWWHVEGTEHLASITEEGGREFHLKPDNE